MALGQPNINPLAAIGTAGNLDALTASLFGGGGALNRLTLQAGPDPLLMSMLMQQQLLNQLLLVLLIQLMQGKGLQAGSGSPGGVSPVGGGTGGGAGAGPAGGPSGAPNANVGSGETASGQLVERQGEKIDRSIADNFDAMVAAAKQDGVTLEIESGWRSRQEQEALYAKYGPGRAAKPGTSNHEKGVAIDFKNTPGAWDWLKKNAQRFGLKNLPSEAWHYSVDGR